MFGRSYDFVFNYWFGKIFFLEFRIFILMISMKAVVALHGSSRVPPGVDCEAYIPSVIR